jgi:hypothetical protein
MTTWEPGDETAWMRQMTDEKIKPVFTMTNDELAAAIEATHNRLGRGTSGWEQGRDHYINLMAEQHRRAITRAAEGK